MNWWGFERKRSWFNFKVLFGIRLEGLRKTTENLCREFLDLLNFPKKHLLRGCSYLPVATGSEILIVCCKNREAACCITLRGSCMGCISVALAWCSEGCLQSPLINMTYAVRSINRGRDRLKLWWSRGWWRISRDAGHLRTFSLSAKLYPTYVSWCSYWKIRRNSYSTNADIRTYSTCVHIPPPCGLL
jgi:hypothetical protein